MRLHALVKLMRRHFDWPLMFIVLAIVCIGLLNLYSATRYVPRRGVFGQQLLWIGIGLVVMTVFALLDYRVWLRAAWILVLVAIGGILAVRFVGVVVNESRRWIGVAGIGGQPSELAKIAVIIGLARLVCDRESGLPWFHLIVRVAGFVVTIVLIAIQPDLGTAALVLLICLSVTFLMAKKLWPLLVGSGVALAASPLLWKYALLPKQRGRILALWDPSSHSSGFGWQARQSLLAIGSGRGTGKGFMEGTQNRLNFVPEQLTDFPFSVWAEEWGFLGSTIVLILYLALIFWTLNIASETRDRFGATLCCGVAAMLFWHVLVNISMVTALAPVVGVTLPLISYGGSSMLTVFVGLGLVASVSIRRYVH